MWNVVTGLMMLVGSVVREQGQSFGDLSWRREAQGGASEARANEATVTVVAGPASGTIGAIEGGPMSAAADDSAAADGEADTSTLVPGDWDVACNRKRGTSLVFDRQSVRVLGSETLFRWAAPAGVMPEADDRIYTGVADCHGKSIEASWPGKSTQTQAGTCGRHLVEAVCAAASRPAPH